MKRVSWFSLSAAMCRVCLCVIALGSLLVGLASVPLTAAVLDFEASPNVTLYRSLDSYYSWTAWNTEVFSVDAWDSTSAWETGVSVQSHLDNNGFFWANPKLDNQFPSNVVQEVPVGTVGLVDLNYTVGNVKVTAYSLASDAAEAQNGWGYAKGGFGLANGFDSRVSYDSATEPFVTGRAGDDVKVWLPGITQAENTYLVGFSNTWGNVFASTQYQSSVVAAEDLPNYDSLPTLKFSSPVTLESLDVANVSYAGLIMKNGSSFGGEFSEDDYYNLKITGYNASGDVVADTIKALATGTNITDSWQTVALGSNFKNLSQLKFEILTSGGENWGVPSVFALDNIRIADSPAPGPEPTQTPEPATWLLLVLGSGLAALRSRRFGKRAVC